MTFSKLAILAALASAPSLWAQTWTIDKVVDNTTTCPGSTGGVFNPEGAFPAIDGPWVVFLDGGDDNCTSNNGPSIWSYNLITQKLTKLVDTTTPIPPSGTDIFAGLSGVGSVANLQVNNGTVLFYGYGSDSNTTTNCGGGVYTVSVAGGTIYRVVDYTMSLPGYGGSFCGLNNSNGTNGLQGLSISNGKVIFSALAEAPGQYANSGIWSAPADVNTTESDLKLIADGSTPETVLGSSITSWTGGFTQSGITMFTGGGGTSPAGLFLDSPKLPVIVSSRVLPGDTGHDTSHPSEASNFFGPIVDGYAAYFVGSDPFYTGTCANGGSGTGNFIGVFKTSVLGYPIENILNTCDTQPNGDAIAAGSFNQMAANQGTAVFEVLDRTTGNYVIDAYVNGAISVLLAPGEPLPTGATCSGGYHAVGCTTGVSAPGTGAVNGGRVVFGASGGPYWYDDGIYVASLGCAASDTSDVSVSLGTPTQSGSVLVETATITNTSSAALEGPLSLVLKGLTSGATLLNRNGTTVCFAPVNSPYITLNLTGNALAAGKSTQVALEFYAPGDTSVSFTSEIAGPGAR